MEKLPDIPKEVVKEAVKLFASLPPPKKELIKTPKETCMCGHLVDVTDLEVINTGVINVVSDTCKNCKEGKEANRRTALLVCALCKRVIARLYPKTDKQGFTYQAGKAYHTHGCPFCNLSGKENFTIIEKAMWNRAHGIKRSEPNT